MKISFFCNVALCCLIDVYQHFGGACCLHLQAEKSLKMDTQCSSETSVNIDQVTQCHMPKDTTLYSHYCENLINLKRVTILISTIPIKFCEN